MDSQRFIFLCPTSIALVYRHQLSLLYVELPVLDDFPSMKTTLAQCFTLVLFRQFLVFKREYVCHDVLAAGSHMIAMQHQLEPLLAHENNDLDSHKHDENYHYTQETMRVLGERDTAYIDTEQTRQETQRKKQCCNQ